MWLSFWLVACTSDNLCCGLAVFAYFGNIVETVICERILQVDSRRIAYFCTCFPATFTQILAAIFATVKNSTHVVKCMALDGVIVRPWCVQIQALPASTKNCCCNQRCNATYMPRTAGLRCSCSAGIWEASANKCRCCQCRRFSMPS